MKHLIRSLRAYLGCIALSICTLSCMTVNTHALVVSTSTGLITLTAYDETHAWNAFEAEVTFSPPPREVSFSEEESILPLFIEPPMYVNGVLRIRGGVPGGIVTRSVSRDESTASRVSDLIGSINVTSDVPTTYTISHITYYAHDGNGTRIPHADITGVVTPFPVALSTQSTLVCKFISDASVLTRTSLGAVSGYVYIGPSSPFGRLAYVASDGTPECTRDGLTFTSKGSLMVPGTHETLSMFVFLDDHSAIVYSQSLPRAHTTLWTYLPLFIICIVALLSYVWRGSFVRRLRQVYMHLTSRSRQK